MTEPISETPRADAAQTGSTAPDRGPAPSPFGPLRSPVFRMLWVTWLTANVCMCGSDGTFDSMGEGMFCDFDGRVMAEGGNRPDEIITAELRPDLVREARARWGVENNPYQLFHRGYVAVKGGAQDCPYTFMQDMVAGTYRLPWEDEVVHTDGAACGFAPPTRDYDPLNCLPKE